MSTLQVLPQTKAAAQRSSEIVYPDSDGEPMADNTKQADIMVWLKTNFDDLFASDPDVFVAMDLLWYPVEGDNKTRMAPDVMLAFGAGKGYRGSYKQWEEGVPFQVVFEIWSPRNRIGNMHRKFLFYERYGVEEYYIYNPDGYDLSGWRRDAGSARLTLIDPIDGFVSPRLGVRFDATGDGELMIYRPDGSPFKTPLEVREALEQAEAENTRLAAERDKATAERDKAAAERDEIAQENARLAAKLRELGIDTELLR